MKNVIRSSAVNIFRWRKKNCRNKKKIISRRQHFCFYSHCVKDTYFGFIYFPALCVCSCFVPFPFFLSLFFRSFWLLLINCYFYDIMGNVNAAETSLLSMCSHHVFHGLQWNSYQFEILWHFEYEIANHVTILCEFEW